MELDWNYINSESYMPKCENPLRIVVKGVKRYVPCGNCIHCQNRIKQSWLTRLNAENRYWRSDDKCFITLTFDDAHLFDSSYKKVQDFIKRVRIYAQRHNYSDNVKYFGCFERGEKYGRPHYHILFWGLNPQKWLDNKKKDYKIINDWFANKFWRNGFVKIEKLDDNAINYVVGYVLKKQIDYEKIQKVVKNKSEYNKVNRWSFNDQSAGFLRGTFYFMSKNIGLRFLLQHYKKIVKSCSVCMQGKKYMIPRYYIVKLLQLYNIRIFDYDIFYCPPNNVTKKFMQNFQKNFDDFFPSDEDLTIAWKNYKIDVNQVVDNDFFPDEIPIILAIQNYSKKYYQELGLKKRCELKRF